MAGRSRAQFGRCPIVSPCVPECAGRSAECRLTCEAYKRYEAERMEWHKAHNEERDPWRTAHMARKAEDMAKAHRSRRR